MPDPSESSPPEREPPRRHRPIVWTLIVLASVLLVLSITANWVQRALLDTDEVTDTTSEIVADGDVEEQLSIFAVDQLYAAVDVQGAIEKQLPPPAQALAAPAGAAVRQLATDVAERALASPQVQDLVSGSIARAHARFVNLIRDEGEYVATTGGDVTLEYGSIVADLAARLGLDPATISEVQGIVQDFAEDLRGGLTEAQTQIESLRAGLSDVQAGALDPELEAGLEALNANAAELEGGIAGLEEKIAGVQEQVPSQLQGRLSDLLARLADVDDRLAALEGQTAAVLEDPSQANVDALDASLATIQPRVTAVLERQVVQSPGEFVVMDSTQLDGLQAVVGALRNLGIVLPLLVLLLYVAALYLAKGWRREALIAAGGGILAATLLVLLARRVTGTQLVPALASSETVEPAVASIWEIVSDTLRQRALFVLVVGLAFVGAGLLAGPGRPAVATRRFLAPYLRENRVAVYSVVAALFLLWLTFIPGIDNLGQVVVIVLLAVLAVVGVEVLRRQTAREFSGRQSG
jgi:uncharacterized coiled-coil protein SlyX